MREIAAANLSTLERCEAVIERGLVAFVEVGRALLVIHDRRFYKDAACATFEDYCRQRWGLERRQPYRLMDAAKVTELLCPMGHILPSNERVVRPLTPLLKTPDTLRQAWSETVRAAPTRDDGTPIITARHVEETVAQIRHVASEPGPFPGRGYRVVYADPPWRYAYERPGHGAAGDHYPTMTFDEIKTFSDGTGAPIGEVAATNAVLFLWATSALLPEALAVVDAWGFTYKTSIVWDKVRHNFGYYVSVRHELLLIATRGNCTPDSNTLHDSVVSIERTKKHSEKPERFREIIDEMYSPPEECIDRIELFARKCVPHWDVFGNQCMETQTE